ncbi:hypothetical protein HAX54_043443, partial [Datura stramonium]|nr:hypothetical protein [Datura stramonium]
LLDESESESSSGSEVHYNIETSNKYLVVTTKAKSKAREAVAATASPPQSEEGGKEAEFDGEHPPADNSGDNDSEAEESGNKDSAAEKSDDQGSRNVYYAGLALNEKGNPSRSIQEEPKIQINALNEVLELERIFEGYNIYWMAKTLGKYKMEMGESIPIDISERTITRVLMDGDYKLPTRTTEYDYRMEAMKGIRKLSTEDKVMHIQWIENIIAEDKDGAEWVTGRLQGFPEFFGQVMYLLNIPQIISIEIWERVVKDHTTLLFPSMVYQLCMESRVTIFPDIDHMITNIRMAYIALIKDDLNPVAR